MGRDDKARKKARKERNKAAHAKLLEPTGVEGRNRWQGQVSFQLGKHPDTRLDLTWSGLRVPIDTNDVNHLEAAVALTKLALKGDDGERN